MEVYWSKRKVEEAGLELEGSSAYVSWLVYIGPLQLSKLSLSLALTSISLLISLLPTMARAPCCHFASRHNLFYSRSSGNASSSPSVPASPDSRVQASDSSMDVDRYPFCKESLKASIDGRPAITRLDDVPYVSAIYSPEEEDFFSTSSDRRPLPDSLEEGVELDSLPAKMCHAQCYFPISQYLSLVIRVFLDNAFKFRFCVDSHPFPMSLFCHDGINVSPAQLMPNAWVFLRDFEKICESVEVPPSLRFFFHLFQVQFRSVEGYIFIRLETSSHVLSHISQTAQLGWPISSRTYAQFLAEKKIIVDVSSSSASSGGALNVVPAESISPQSAPSARRQNPSIIPSVWASSPVGGSISKRVHSRQTNEEGSRHQGKEPAVESPRRHGKKPVEKDERPRTRQRAQPSTHLSLGDLHYPQENRRSPSLLYLRNVNGLSCPFIKIIGFLVSSRFLIS
ncbi:DNA ligase 1-like [Senna tora]|uniref:DNA ligase 1-like n=1 Tax=Senna tora TaxID=362788 RepID=A0A834TP90_9FABA|nr:DNA ligase 1-like [Senna tora]